MKSKLRKWHASYSWISRDNLTGVITLRCELYSGKAGHPNETPQSQEGRMIAVRLTKEEAKALAASLLDMCN